MLMRVLLLSILSMICTAAATAAPGAVNGRWNEGSQGGGGKYLNLSVYEKAIDCAESRGALLRVGVKDRKPGTASLTLKREETDFCLFFLDDSPPALRCGSGSLELSYDAQSNEYRGKYQFRLNDSDLREKKMKVGEVRSGEFVAQYCKPKPPAKK
jgi:hypothetical protein